MRRLLAYLNSLDPSLQPRISRLLRSGAMHTRVAEEFMLHADDVVEVKANTNDSAGYCYVVAYFTHVADEEVRAVTDPASPQPAATIPPLHDADDRLLVADLLGSAAAGQVEHLPVATLLDAGADELAHLAN